MSWCVHWDHNITYGHMPLTTLLTEVLIAFHTLDWVGRCTLTNF